MQERKDWLKLNVCSSFADDYEDLEMVLKTIHHWAGEVGMSFTDGEIIAMLKQVIAEGLANAHKFAPPDFRTTVIVEFKPEDCEYTYFYLTDAGKKFQSQ